MHVVFRTDASLAIGTGHVMRCLALAEALQRMDVRASFICRAHEGHLIELIQARGIQVFSLPESKKNQSFESRLAHAEWLGCSWEEDKAETIRVLDNLRPTPDWLIIDHYAIDAQWEQCLRLYVHGIMAIDDLADRSHHCDILLDQNLYFNADARYAGLIPSSCLLLLGPRYALLRPEFKEARKNLRERNGSVKRILIFFGGVDQHNMSGMALEAIQSLNRQDIAVDLVVGRSNPHAEVLQSRCAQIPNTHFHLQVDNMAQLMATADLAIGAGGVASWERCCLGLPAIIISIARNQIAIAENVGRADLGIYLGPSEIVSKDDLVRSLTTLIGNAAIVKEISSNAMVYADGLGVSRVCEALNNHRRAAL
ncbi:MAG: UDP-2,4-diacetamido-2,4,6-trideoxy-beta-L-altropyranose hydrolase [Desulfobacteraceae bacterium]|nr:UDP-2,4-diacetamido-2,4,6-trideoxy-beta-L-altropyranose hydrolase [Desulfobacteraceae bacterium]